MADGAFTVRCACDVLGMPRTLLYGLVSAGLVTPARGPRREWLFSFADLSLLRIALQLHRQAIPTRRLLAGLRAARAQLPGNSEMGTSRLRSAGGQLVVDDVDGSWEAQRGQAVFNFDDAQEEGTAVTHLAPVRRAAKPAALATASDCYVRGCEAEASGAFQEAERAFGRALALDPKHLDAMLELSAMLCGQGRCDDAVALCESAESTHGQHATFHFNWAIALEDQGRLADALARYERCLALQPLLADAHHNAARLCDRLGDAQGRLRHLSALARLRHGEEAE